MKKHWRLVLSLVVLFAGVLAFCAVLYGEWVSDRAGPGPTLSNYYRIYSGMPHAEFHAILHTPGMPGAEFTKLVGDEYVTALSLGGIRDRNSLRVWWHSRYGVEIYVWFDEDGAVRDKDLYLRPGCSSFNRWRLWLFGR